MSLDIEDPAQLDDYLRSTNRIGATEKVHIRTLAGGVSNKTVFVKREAGEAWVLKQALAKLRVKVDWFSDPMRIHREAAALRWLPKLAPPDTITPLIFEDRDHHLLAMQAVPEPHENWKTMLLDGRLETDHVVQFAGLLAGIHLRSAQQVEPLAREFDDRSFFESLRLEPYYLYAAEQEPRAERFLRDLVDETRSTRTSLVHGDYSPKNVLVHDSRLVLLDHEGIHWGDPAFDLGFALTHLLSKAHHLSSLRQQFLQAATVFWDHYAAEMKSQDVPPLDQRVVRHTLACMLGRVVGRSPLEYLSDAERQRQRELVVAIMNEGSGESIASTMREFTARLER
ncbi:MAG: aminoglycoside phosphotransferase family protein, partial [Betaproteobacteria bacterium]|nr:aminoglycoside phosphotransferase family protein [Betaproteobacteria bacterium]